MAKNNNRFEHLDQIWQKIIKKYHLDIQNFSIFKIGDGFLNYLFLKRWIKLSTKPLATQYII
jgi:hypothetical protein